MTGRADAKLGPMTSLLSPVGDIALFCRVKSLVRLKMLTDELRLRAGTKDHAGASGDVLMDPNLERDGKILFVDAGRDLFDRISEAAGLPHSIALITDPHRAITEVAEGAFELVAINLESQKFDGVRLCAQLRSIEKTRHIPILVIVESDNTRRLMQALDVGCNDYLRRPVDFHEFLARVKTQIKRCRCTATLRADVTQSIEFPATDPLTGLFNRRFMERRLSSLLSEAVSCGKSLGVLALDIDQFKSVNEVHGPDAGDQILRELASRMKDSIGHLDLACRTGGEEFVIVVPNADVEEARAIAERLRNRMGTQPFSACAAMSNRIDITVSIGVAMIDGVEDSPEKLLKRADAALYRAKRAGRNQIDVAAA